MTDQSRRQFVKKLMAGIAMTPAILSQQAYSSAGIPTRPLGKTGERVSIIGYGGWDFIQKKTEIESIRHLHEAVDGGITFMDNAWEYNRGKSEEVMGKALSQGGYRKKVFLMTKVCARDYKTGVAQISESLQRLQTDHVDLLQVHSIQYPGDPQRVFDPENGVMKAILEAKKAGKTKYIGFSGHMFPEMHLEMINNMSMDWDAVQLPLNILDAQYNSFQKQVLPLLNQKGIAPLGMKSLGAQNGRIAGDLNISADLCRRYTMSLPVATTICGIQTFEELREDLARAQNFKPLTEDDINRMLDLSKVAASNGHIEAYKDMTKGFGCSHHSKVLRG
jgi:uncharacterized protein